MNNNEILETIDCTPTWEALLLPMLDLYAQYKNVPGINIHNKQENILLEFKSMAKAADKWNAHCKASK